MYRSSGRGALVLLNKILELLLFIFEQPACSIISYLKILFS